MIFGKVLKKNPSLRNKMVIQSKCGIHRSETTHYDFSKDYILSCVDASLGSSAMWFSGLFAAASSGCTYGTKRSGEAFDHFIPLAR